MVLAFVFFPLGLLFSVIGLVKSKARGGSGKILSIVGIVLSLIAAVPVVIVTAELFGPTADPGCVAQNEALPAANDPLSAAEDAMIRDEGTPAERADAQRILSDAEALRSELNIAAAKARKQSVRTAIGMMISDVDRMMSGARAVQQGDDHAINQVLNAHTAVIKADGSLTSICPQAVL